MKKVHNKKEVTISESEYIEFLKLKEENTTIKEENFVIKEENFVIKEEYSVIKEENLVLEQKISNLLEQLSKFKRDKFGSSSEKASEELTEQMSMFFNEAEFTEDQFESQNDEKEEGKSDEKKETKKKSAKKQNRSGSIEDVLPENTQKEIHIHELPPEERICPCCNTEMSKIGKDIHKSLKIIPAQFIQKEDHYITYACKCCEKEGTSTPILNTPRENTVIPGSFASPEVIAYLAYQKYVMYSPLYRIELDFNNQGIMLSRQTMSNWMLKATEDWLIPVYEALIGELLTRNVLHADETTIQVLHEPGKKATSKSYMWLYRSSGDTDRAITIYK